MEVSVQSVDWLKTVSEDAGRGIQTPLPLPTRRMKRLLDLTGATLGLILLSAGHAVDRDCSETQFTGRSDLQSNSRWPQPTKPLDARSSSRLASSTSSQKSPKPRSSTIHWIRSTFHSLQVPDRWSSTLKKMVHNLRKRMTLASPPWADS